MGKKNHGITHVKQMVNYEMERIERTNKGKTQVLFKQRETGQDFNLFEMAHFRLLGDDKYLPYGSSLLNKIRRVFRQLILAEDSMLTYRITRAGEKRVFKLDVGNIDEDDIEEYVQKTMARFKKQQDVNFDNGQIDYRYNILGVDEDFVLPVRNSNSQTGIDTLPGAQNLDQIADIEYLRDNLFTGIGVPKPFLGFQEAAGDGKNMAQMDIRFAKKVNRIQQAIIQELNKMAMIHLYLLGFDKEYTNFSLSLTNPSTQQEMLMAEMMQQQATVYTELTRVEGGIAAMSHTNAKRKIFGMSDKEIVEDLKMQRMERAVAQELEDSPLVIRDTTIFRDIDAKYGSGEAPEGGVPEGGEAGEGTAEPNEPPVGGGDEDAPQSPAELPPVLGQGQGFKPDEKKPPMMNEKEYQNYSTKFDQFVSNMVDTGSLTTKKTVAEKKVINENKDSVKKLNETAIEMTKEIDGLIKEGESINSNIVKAETFSGERLQKFIDETIDKNKLVEKDEEEKKG